MSAQLSGVALLEQSSTPLFPLGTVHEDEQGRCYIYAIANGAVTAGYTCYMLTDGTYDMAHVTTTLAGTPGTHWKQLAVACRDFTDNYYGWYWIGPGFFEVVLANAFSAGDVVYTTDSAGILGADNSSFQCDGLKSIDAGVTATRVTVYAADRLTCGVVEASD